MCGIGGVFQPRGVGADDLSARVSRMGAALAHRGPDGEGQWTDPDAGIALSHRRLAILDLTDQGAQPMRSSDGRWVMVFNGEIYNYRELAAGLRAAGHVFRGSSDSEVLLELVARSSPLEALGRLNGMFAIALWDRVERTLTLARDRLGEKPLYYTQQEAGFVFASDLKALRAHGGLELEVDPDSVAHLLRLSFVPGPGSIFAGVSKLGAGELVTVTADGPAAPARYWSLADVEAAGRSSRAGDEPGRMLDEADELLRDSVRMRMVSDVPLGAFLSGGVDSSLVVAMMQAESRSAVRTFTVSVGGAYDESRAAEEVARHVGTDHTTLDLLESEAVELATRIPAMYEEPFADPSAIPVGLMCAAAREHVTVCLTGDGGDETLAGYNRYLVSRGALGAAGRFPVAVGRPLGRAIRRVPPARWDSLLSPANRSGVPDLGTKMHKLGSVLQATSPRDVYLGLLSNDSAESVLLRRAAPPDSWNRSDGVDDLHKMMLADGLLVLPDDMLAKVDRASMASSLECRVPLLDHRFVEFAWRLPTTAKMRDGRGKWLLRELLTRYVPPSLWDRPKQGFDPPLAGWLRGPLRSWMTDLLAPERLARHGLVDARAVGALVDAHLRGRRNYDYTLWALIVLEAFLERLEAPAPV